MSANVVVAGYLARDPELKTVGGDEKVANLSIPVKVKTRDGEETNWYSISFWGWAAETLQKYTRKGSFLVVHGRLTARAVGEKLYLDVRGTDFTFGPKPQEREQESDTASEDIPF